MSSNNIIPIKINKPYYVEKSSNLFSEIKYVPLEETRNSIVSEISKLEITTTGEFVIFDSRAGAVFRFDSKGKFLNNIGVRGAGEKEYVLPLDMKYDPFNNEVVVWDNGKSAILRYGINGDYLSKIQLPWIISTFGIIDKNHIICYMNNDENIHGNEKGTNYKIINREGLIEKQFGEYGIDRADFNPAAEHTFCFQLGRCLCFPPYSSTLFCVEGDSLNAIASFNLFEKAIPDEWLSGSNRDLWEKLKKDSDHVIISAVYETSQYYILKLIRKQINMLCVVRKSDNNVVSIYENIINDVYGLVGNCNLVYTNNDKLYYWVEPMEFDGQRSLAQTISKDKNLRATIKKNRDKMFAKLASIVGEEGANAYIDSLESTKFTMFPEEADFVEKMSINNNPLIQICTLKY